ncbi:hypothetical protein JM658_02365 [Joostella atrarenae]|uniref:DUF1129 domain-containing protein n=1 Tax=Joostella atrarenae TaxID=679257 RepID=A0ABS9IZQ6_9FLAO|nr:hypothetical protein [Joostella atrarenae]MCF8713657.1 hypothetical protein [Joostella atrarenae]
MTLNQEQLNTIKYALEKRDLDYVDLKYELLDHIATEIEQIMSKDESVSFKDASDIAFDKWRIALNDYSSFWLGIGYSKPKILIDSCVSIVKDLTFKLVGFGVLISLLLFLILKVYPLEVSDGFASVVGIFQYAIVAILLVLFLIIKRSGFKTSYSFVYNINVVSLVLYYVLFNVGFGIYAIKSQDFDFINIFIQVEMLLYPFYAYWMFKKHFNVKKNVLRLV